MSELEKEEQIKSQLEEKFGADISNFKIDRTRRIYFEVKKESAVKIISHMKKEMNFNHIPTITGMDFGDDLGAIYHISNPGIVASITVKTPASAPTLDTITEFFIGAEYYERELEDMLGIKINGLAPGRRYPLPEDFPEDEYPLRKNWDQKKFEDSAAESKSEEQEKI